jgi:ABC-2 type transport system permease protein
MITRGRDVPAPRVARGAVYLALAAAGFRRYATYRQAMVAAMFTNSIFGFLRCSVLLALAGAGTVAGYDEPRLATFVWAGQGLIGVVLLWAPNELADRIRTGDVIADLLRPVDLVWQLLAADLGRAGLAVLTRFVGPVVVGALAFHLYAPRRPATYVLFACSMLLATIVCFGCRFLVNAAAYWLLDARGPQVAWTLLSALLGGLYFPLWFLPRAAAVLLIAATPFPSLIQLPLDVLVERGPPAEQVMWLAVQAVWAAAILALCRWVQRRGERKLVVQGG